ncbi:DUF2793 domain-containing protein [Rhizobium sp.]|jgi:hypothetical protein|uniref:DUF2793 domain-containing protein n=1 Tax=Rhizobium sp. TaxID=391 RepID=UPI002AA95697
MTDTTPRLALPYILPSQAQKHVTHNEALAILDAVTQLVIENSLTSPPDSPSNGNCYWVLTSATGVWSGHDSAIAVWQDSVWAFLTPQTGWLAFFRNDNKLQFFSGAGWTDLSLPSNAQFSQLGVNATADGTNKLAVSSEAILFNHNGGDQRVKLNKAASGNTASLLYQSNWTGKAEIGLAGSDDLSIKVCDTDGNWTTALTITGQGYVQQPAKPAATARYASTSKAVSDGASTGFEALVLVQGGMALGNSLGSNGNSLKVPVAGTYQLSLTLSVSAATNYVATLVDASQTSLMKIAVGTTTNSIQTSHTTLATLNAGVELSVLHAGSATLGLLSPGAMLTAVLL